MKWDYASTAQKAVTITGVILLIAYLVLAFLMHDWWWPTHLGSPEKGVATQSPLKSDTVKNRQLIAWQKYSDTLKNHVATLQQDSLRAHNHSDSLQKEVDKLRSAPPAVPKRTHANKKGHRHRKGKAKNKKHKAPPCGCPTD